MNMVKILQVSKIFPSSAHSSTNSTSKFSLSLATLDWFYLKCPPVERLFFYALPQIDSIFHSILIPNLKHSLSLTLQHFLPLAGNLIWPEDSPLPFILYARNDAVSFVVAETDSDFHHLTGDQPRLIKDSQSLLPNFQISNSSAPMLAIQVTKFPNHGFSFAFATHHVLVDGESFSLFLKSWTHICKKLNHRLELSCPLPSELNPSLERGSQVHFQNPFDFLPKNRNLNDFWLLAAPPNWVRATVKFTPTHIQKLKETVLNSTKKASSTFVVVYGYVLICLIKAKQDECGKHINLTLTTNMRGVLDPPLPSNYFGNCVTHKDTLVEAREFREEDGSSFLKIVKKISDLILETRRSSSVGGVEVPKPYELEQRRDLMSRIEYCSVVDSPKFKFYETDFGWGKPKKIELASMGINNICLNEARDGSGGVEVGIVLPNHRQMDVFVSLFAKGLKGKSSL